MIPADLSQGGDVASDDDDDDVVGNAVSLTNPDAVKPARRAALLPSVGHPAKKKLFYRMKKTINAKVLKLQELLEV